jgi:large subunit ribosomal protein L3
MKTRMGLLGRKLGMTQIFDEAGRVVPVTAIELGPNTVLQVKSPNSDGYAAIQLGFHDRPALDVKEEVLKRAQGRVEEYDLRYERVPKPERRRCLAVGTAPKYFVREIRLPEEEAKAFTPGQKLAADLFAVGDHVDVEGTSKGRGFTGVVKRHGFAKFGSTHGTHQWRRHAGSIGCRKPQHTRRGHRMAGHHGNARVTVQSLQIAALEPERNLMLVKGAVPGPNGGYVVVRKALRRK